jgi:hypothetical protein
MRETNDRQATSNTLQPSSRKRDAVRRKSGESVDHSDPGLMEPSIPRTADRKSAARVKGEQGVSLRPATHQHKNGQGLGQSPISAEGAVLSPLLDTIQNNGDSPRDPYRLSRCGKLSLRGVPPTADLEKFIGLTCKCWNCPRCGPRKANRYRKAIGTLAEAHRLSTLLTLTLDPKKLNGEDSTLYINRIFRHFRVYLKRKLHRSPQYIRILEHQKNGNAHLHILLNAYIPQAWISSAWASLGGGKIVDVRHVSMQKVSHYLSKYLTKEMLLTAPKRSRRVTTSRGLKLNPKILTEWKWNLVSVPITRLYEVYWKSACDVKRDAEDNVTGFERALPTGTPNLVKPVSATRLSTT